MFSSYSFSAFARTRLGGQNAEIQTLFESSNTTLEEVLKFPNIATELQGSIDSRNFFTPQRVEQLIRFVFDPNTVAKIPFEDARKITYAASELLTMKIASISEFFFHPNCEPKIKKLSIAGEEIDSDVDNEIGAKELLLSPVNSVKSKSTTTVDSYNKASLDFLLAKALESPIIDETRAGYLNKVLISFFQKYKNEFLTYLFKSGFEFRKLAAFMESFSIADLISSITFFESGVGNDSIVFHDSQVQSSNDHPKARLELLKAVFNNPRIAKSKEVASNVKFIMEEFLTKYKNINEADFLFYELISSEKILSRFFDCLISAQNPDIEFQMMGILRSFAKFVLTCSSSKTEVLNDACRNLFLPNGALSLELLSLSAKLQLHFFSKSASKITPDSFIWINTFKKASVSNAKSNILFLEFCYFMLKQKFIPFNSQFTTRDFLSFLLVGL